MFRTVKDTFTKLGADGKKGCQIPGSFSLRGGWKGDLLAKFCKMETVINPQWAEERR